MEREELKTLYRMDRQSWEFTREITGVTTALRKYCHSPECTDYNSCPREHSQCQDRLDLDTAIAWQAGNQLDWVKECISGLTDNYPRHLHYVVQEINSTRRILFNFRWAVLEHREKYRELSNVIEDTIDVITRAADFYQKRLDKQEEEGL